MIVLYLTTVGYEVRRIRHARMLMAVVMLALLGTACVVIERYLPSLGLWFYHASDDGGVAMMALNAVAACMFYAAATALVWFTALAASATLEVTGLTVWVWCHRLKGRFPLFHKLSK
ncbi:MAG TPA: hypothetical protein VLF91_06735 [Candidatus Saccharimonadales bacterium]|nr:hypothetical protein [Candidatus Saccharimonadales bacterium]